MHCFLINFSFGFGILDAETIVNMAKLWKKVPDKMECKVSGVKQTLGSRSMSGSNLMIGENDIHEMVFRSQCNITSLEHVQVVINIDHPSRGQLEVMWAAMREVMWEFL